MKNIGVCYRNVDNFFNNKSEKSRNVMIVNLWKNWFFGMFSKLV